MCDLPLRGVIFLTKNIQTKPDFWESNWVRLVSKNDYLEWRIALTGRWFVLLAIVPKAPLRLPWAMCNLPLRGVLSIIKIIRTKTKFVGIHLGLFG